MITDETLYGTQESAADLEMRFAIADGLARALAEAPFDRVKVQRICEIAHVSRQTFYRHFRSKDDIPTWHINHYFRVGTFQIGRTLDWHRGHLTTLRGLFESGEFYRRLERPRGCLPLRQYGTQAHANNLKETVLLLKGRAPDDLLTFQIDTFARTRTDITKKWISDGMSIDPETFATYTDSIVPRELFDLLNEPCLTECRRVPATTLKSCPPRGG